MHSTFLNKLKIIFSMYNTNSIAFCLFYINLVYIMYDSILVEHNVTATSGLYSFFQTLHSVEILFESCHRFVIFFQYRNPASCPQLEIAEAAAREKECS